jgi:hypothetical protein
MLLSKCRQLSQPACAFEKKSSSLYQLFQNTIRSKGYPHWQITITNRQHHLKRRGLAPVIARKEVVGCVNTAVDSLAFVRNKYCLVFRSAASG